MDAQDNILVADWGNSRIQIFDSQGSFLSFVNTLAACPLYGPQGLALTHDGHVVVADSGNHCFKLYKYLQWYTDWRNNNLLKNAGMFLQIDSMKTYHSKCRV